MAEQRNQLARRHAHNYIVVSNIITARGGRTSCNDIAVFNTCMHAVLITTNYVNRSTCAADAGRAQ